MRMGTTGPNDTIKATLLFDRKRGKEINATVREAFMLLRYDRFDYEIPQPPIHRLPPVKYMISYVFAI